MDVLSFPVTPFMSNCFVLRSGGQSLVVDPGEATPQVLDAMRDAQVVGIVDTHGHCDHCGGNAALVEATGAPLMCHEADAPLLATIAQQGVMFGVPFDESPEPDRLLADGDTLTVGEETLRVLHVPGHSPGHIALAADGFVLAGDVLFSGSIGRTDLPGGSYRQLLASIRDNLLVLPDDTVVHCGHGPSTTIGAERRSNPFLVAS